MCESQRWQLLAWLEGWLRGEELCIEPADGIVPCHGSFAGQRAHSFGFVEGDDVLETSSVDALDQQLS